MWMHRPLELLAATPIVLACRGALDLFERMFYRVMLRVCW